MFLPIEMGDGICTHQIFESFKIQIFESFGISIKLKYNHLSILRGDYWKFDRNTIWDRIVFKRLHALLGGEVLHIVTGSAPIDPKVLNFFRCAFGCHVSFCSKLRTSYSSPAIS